MGDKRYIEVHNGTLDTQAAPHILDSIASSPLSSVPSDFDVGGDNGYTFQFSSRATRSIEALQSPLATNSSTFDAAVTSEAIESLLAKESVNQESTNQRPSRKRVVPTRYFEEAVTSDEKPEKHIAPTRAIRKIKSTDDKPQKATISLTRKQQPIRGNWTTAHLLTNPRSRFATCNLSDLLNNERAWTSLTREEQLKLISMLPDSSLPDLPSESPLPNIPNIPKHFLGTNSSFQADIRLFQEDLAAGRYDPQWLEDAQNAMEKRAKGHFDDWKEKNREEFWGQKQKVDWTALAGDSSKHKLSTLVKAECFKAGDIWLLRGRVRAAEASVVEKEAMITHINAATNTLTFCFPRGTHKFSSPANGVDIEFTTAPSDSPTPLSDAMVKEDGRMSGVRQANVWKDFRCYRRNQDMGSLWDIRELYHQRQAEEEEKEKEDELN